MVDQLPQRIHARHKTGLLSIFQQLEIPFYIVDVVEIRRDMVVPRFGSRAAHQTPPLRQDAVLIRGRLLRRAGMPRIAAPLGICRRIDVYVVGSADSQRRHLFHFFREPMLPGVFLADPITLSARPKSAFVERSVGAFAHPFRVPQPRTHVAVRVRGVQRELVAERLGFPDEPQKGIRAAGFRAYGEMPRHAPVVAAVLPAGRTDGQLVDARILEGLQKLLRDAEGHVDGDGRLLAFLEEEFRVAFVGDRLRGMRLDAHDRGFAEIRQLGAAGNALFYRPDAAVFALVPLVGFRKPVVVRPIPVQPAEIDHDVAVKVREKRTHAVAPESRIDFVGAVFCAHGEIVAEAPRFDVGVPQRIALLHTEDRHQLAFFHVQPVVLVEAAEGSPCLDPVTGVALLRAHETGDHLHDAGVRRDFLFRKDETEAAVSDIRHLDGTQLDTVVPSFIAAVHADRRRLRPDGRHAQKRKPENGKERTAKNRAARPRSGGRPSFHRICNSHRHGRYYSIFLRLRSSRMRKKSFTRLRPIPQPDSVRLRRGSRRTTWAGARW